MEGSNSLNNYPKNLSQFFARRCNMILHMATESFTNILIAFVYKSIKNLESGGPVQLTKDIEY